MQKDFENKIRTVHVRGRRSAVYLHARNRFSFYFCTRPRPIARRWSCPRSGPLAQNVVCRLMSRDMKGQRADAGWFSVFAATCLRESFMTRATPLLTPFGFQACLTFRSGKFFSQAANVESTSIGRASIFILTQKKSAALTDGASPVYVPYPYMVLHEAELVLTNVARHKWKSKLGIGHAYFSAEKLRDPASTQSVSGLAEVPRTSSLLWHEMTSSTPHQAGGFGRLYHGNFC